MIKDLPELKKFLALCRKQGVKEIKFGGVELILGDLPQKRAGDAEEADDSPEGDELTPEQMMFFSVGGAPHP